MQLFWSLYDLNLRQLNRKYGQITVNHIHYTRMTVNQIFLSKYEPLWRFLSGDGSGCIQFSFERIDEILGFPMDHSFLRYKQEAEQYGYRVEKISLKEKWVRFVRIAAQ